MNRKSLGVIKVTTITITTITTVTTTITISIVLIIVIVVIIMLLSSRERKGRMVGIWKKWKGRGRNRGWRIKSIIRIKVIRD